jgi:hypothetical protein
MFCGKRTSIRHTIEEVTFQKYKCKLMYHALNEYIWLLNFEKYRKTPSGMTLHKFISPFAIHRDWPGPFCNGSWFGNHKFSHERHPTCLPDIFLPVVEWWRKKSYKAINIVVLRRMFVFLFCSCFRFVQKQKQKLCSEWLFVTVTTFYCFISHAYNLIFPALYTRVFVARCCFFFIAVPLDCVLSTRRAIRFVRFFLNCATVWHVLRRRANSLNHSIYQTEYRIITESKSFEFCVLFFLLLLVPMAMATRKKVGWPWVCFGVELSQTTMEVLIMHRAATRYLHHCRAVVFSENPGRHSWQSQTWVRESGPNKNIQVLYNFVVVVCCFFFGDSQQ